MGKALQPTSVNGIEFDALINASEGFEAKVPEYPVEAGFSVSDTIILNPESLDMTLFVSNRPVTWAGRFGSSNDRVEQVENQLRELYFNKQLVTISTSKCTYTNMAITSMTISRSNTLGYASEIPIKFKKVRVTAAKTTTIPESYGKSGASSAAAGAANTSKGSSGAVSGSSKKNVNSASGKGSDKKSGSILYNLAGAAGLWG